MGLNISQDTNEMSERQMMNFTKQLLWNHNPHIPRVIIESGFWPSYFDKVLRIWPSLERGILKMAQRYSRPLTLQRLAANVIRTELKPNAVAGLKKLRLPPGFDKSYITLGLDNPGLLYEKEENTSE